MGYSGTLWIVYAGLAWPLNTHRGGDSLAIFGNNCASIVPRDKRRARAWIQRLKRALETEETREKLWEAFEGDELLNVRAGAPLCSLGIGLINQDFGGTRGSFVIHLDWLYFAVDGMPVYNLLNMPSSTRVNPRDISLPVTVRGVAKNKVFKNSQTIAVLDQYKIKTEFVLYLGPNAFGQISYTDDMPVKHRSDVTPSGDANHASCDPVCPTNLPVSAAELLRDHRWKSFEETARINILEAVITALMVMCPDYHVPLYELLVLSTLTGSAATTVRYVGVLLMQQIATEFYDLRSFRYARYAQPPARIEPDWPRLDVCVHYAPFLDDAAHLTAGITAVIALARKRYNSGFLWGIVFSVAHCALVRIDARAGRSCTHTGALQFLPGPFARSRSTEGITALAQLFHIAPAPPAPHAVPAAAIHPSSPLACLPAELLEMIGAEIDHAHDLWSFAHALPPLIRVLDGRLRRIHFANERRVLFMAPDTTAVPDGYYDDLEDEGQEDSDDDEDRYPQNYTHPIYRSKYVYPGDCRSTALLRSIFVCADQEGNLSRITLRSERDSTVFDGLALARSESFREEWSDFWEQGLYIPRGRIPSCDVSFRVAVEPLSAVDLAQCVPEGWRARDAVEWDFELRVLSDTRPRADPAVVDLDILYRLTNLSKEAKEARRRALDEEGAARDWLSASHVYQS